MNARFNLCDEPWIRVMSTDEERLVSLRSLFEQAETHSLLCGELAMQDVSILRLLLAITHRATGSRTGLDAWKEVCDWDTTVAAVNSYLDEHHDRFWLLHPVQPFFQTPLEVQTVPAWRILPEVECDDGRRSTLNSRRWAHEESSLSLAEAARWLVCTQSWDKAGRIQPVSPDLPTSARATTMSRASVVTAAGRTVRETLLLNLITSPDLISTGPEDLPAWERPVATATPDTDLDLTDKEVTRTLNDSGTRTVQGVCDLYTWQARRLQLVADGNRITGVRRAFGDVMSRPDTFANETMSAWRVSAKNVADGKFAWVPHLYTSPAAIWRNLSSLIAPTVHSDYATETTRPSTVLWLERLNAAGLLPAGMSVLDLSVLTVHWSEQKTKVTGLTETGLPIPVHALDADGDAVDSRGINVLAAAVHSSLTDLRKVVLVVRNAVESAHTAVGSNDASARADETERLMYAQLEPMFNDLMLDVADQASNARGRRAMRNVYSTHRPRWHDDLDTVARTCTETVFGQLARRGFVSHNGQNLGQTEMKYRRDVASILDDRTWTDTSLNQASLNHVGVPA